MPHSDAATALVIPAPPTYEATVLAQSPWLYWPLNINGDDASPNARHGVVAAGITFADGGARIPGATDDQRIRSATGVILPTGTVAIEAWIKRHAGPSGNFGTYIQIANPEGSGATLAIMSMVAGTLSFKNADGGGPTNSGAFIGTTWVHLCMVYMHEAGHAHYGQITGHMFFNGSQIGVSGWPQNAVYPTFTGANVLLGGRFDQNARIDMSIARLALWVGQANVPTPTQIAARAAMAPPS